MSKIENKDELVQQLIQIVNEKKEAISKIEKPNWETNSVFYVDGKMSNIKTITSIDKIVELFGHVLNAKQIHEESCKLLNVDTNFKFTGFTFEQWLNDFKNITGQINIKAMKADLDADEKALNKLVSKEKREELELLALKAKLMSK